MEAKKIAYIKLVETIRLLRRLLEQYMNGKKDLYMVFIELKIDLQQSLKGGILRRCMKSRGVLMTYIRVIKNINDGAKT